MKQLKKEESNSVDKKSYRRNKFANTGIKQELDNYTRCLANPISGIRKEFKPTFAKIILGNICESERCMQKCYDAKVKELKLQYLNDIIDRMEHNAALISTLRVCEQISPTAEKELDKIGSKVIFQCGRFGEAIEKEINDSKKKASTITHTEMGITDRYIMSHMNNTASETIKH